MLKKALIFGIILGVMPGLVTAKIAMNSDFQSSSFPIGQVPTSGDGLLTDVNGLWQPVPSGSTGDPSIANDPVDANNKSLRISAGTGNRSTIGTSNMAPINTNESFIASWSVFYRDVSGVLGSSMVFVDNTSYWYDILVSEFCGIGHYNTTLGSLNWQHGPRTAVEIAANPDVSPVYVEGTHYINDCIGKWADIKVYVKTWNDGSGIGYYDTWIRKHGTSNGSDGKWLRGDIDLPFASGNVHDVNGFILKMRSEGGNGVHNYFDNMRIATEAIDCQDKKILGQNFSGDLNGDCKVDFNDIALLNVVWLGNSVSPAAPVWDVAHWDINNINDRPANGRPRFTYETVSPQRTYNDGILEVYSPHSNDTCCGGSALAYLNIRDPNYVAGPPLKYDSNYFNVKLPTLVQCRWRLSNTDSTNEAAFYLRERLYGNLIIRFWPHMFTPGNGYADTAGFITMSFVLSPAAGHLNSATMYFQNQITGKWDEITTIYVDTSTAASHPYDQLMIGDVGGVTYGQYYYDYLYVSQNSVTIQNFLNSVAIQQRDLDRDGTISFKDFTVIASQWYQSANLLP
ncbi:MAG: hypothetical protein A2Y12_09815 [Planctomycetes bacterium GWF2_42_9]|nr:MAG: hypothetical protein A2Y12_09815 [Planctomycetes bacterium GWF2_42_9]